MASGETYLKVGFKQLAQTLREIRHYPMTLRYLIAYLLYNDGIQAVIVVSALFGDRELGMDSSSLILVVLMVQFMAISSLIVLFVSGLPVLITVNVPRAIRKAGNEVQENLGAAPAAAQAARFFRVYQTGVMIRTRFVYT